MEGLEAQKNVLVSCIVVAVRVRSVVCSAGLGICCLERVVA